MFEFRVARYGTPTFIRESTTRGNAPPPAPAAPKGDAFMRILSDVILPHRSVLDASVKRPLRVAAEPKSYPDASVRMPLRVDAYDAFHLLGSAPATMKAQARAKEVGATVDNQNYSMNYNNMMKNITNVKPGCRSCRGTF